MTIESIIEGIGGFGRFQKRTVAVLAFSCIASSILSYSVIFLLAEPAFRCRLGEDDSYSVSNDTLNGTLDRWIPRSASGGYSSCKKYGENTTEEETCNDYVFDDDDGTYSIVSEFQLVCDRKSLASTITTMNFVGRVVGSLLFGVVGDRYGRKRTLIGTMAITTLASITGFIPNVYIVLMSRFIVGTCVTGSFDCCFVIMLEIVGIRSRTLVSSISSLCWSSGYLMSAVVAYFLRNWQYYHIAMTAPSAVALLLIVWLVPESPRWLIAVGKWKEAEQLLRDGSRLNGKPFPEQTFMKISKDRGSMHEVEDIAGLKELCNNGTLMKRVLALCLVWTAVDLGYYGSSLSSGNLFGGIYVNNMLSAGVELPSEILAYSSRFIGRKNASVTAAVLGGAGLVAAGLVQLLANEDNGWTAVAISLVGKTGVSAGYALLYTWTVESVPTAFRSLILGICSTVSGMATIVAPFLVDMYSEHKTTGQAIPSMILGGLLIVSLIATCTIPETCDSELPDSIKESVEMAGVGAHAHGDHHGEADKLKKSEIPI